jgi:apolipoprotein N-acyltransferase
MLSLVQKCTGNVLGIGIFVAIWMSFEKFHLEWELTWPWLNLGNSFSEYPKLSSGMIH